MDTSRDRSSTLVRAFFLVALSAVALGCTRTKIVAPASAKEVEAANEGEPARAAVIDVDASADGFEISGTVDLSGAVPQANMTGSVGEATSKSSIEQICFAPNSAKLPADTSAKLEAAAKQFRGNKTERKRLTVEPVITPRDSQASASKTRAQRTSAIVSALVNKGLDRKSIVVTGPEVPHTEWSMGSMFGGAGAFGGEAAPCVDLAIVTKESTQAGSL